MDTYVLVLEFLFLLVMLYIGSRYGGIGLGVISGVGLIVEVFIFRMPPASAPIEVMLIILAVVTCASILEAAGGLKFMLQVAEKILRKNPKQITFLGPMATYMLTFMLGTGHAVYSLAYHWRYRLKEQDTPRTPNGSSFSSFTVGTYCQSYFGSSNRLFRQRTARSLSYARRAQSHSGEYPFSNSSCYFHRNACDVAL